MRYSKFISELFSDTIQTKIISKNWKHFNFKNPSKSESLYITNALDSIKDILLRTKSIKNSKEYCYNTVANNVNRVPDNYYIKIIGGYLPFHSFITNNHNKIVFDSMMINGELDWPVNYDVDNMIGYEISIEDFKKYVNGEL